MTLQTVTVNVPELLYTRLESRARQSNRSVEAELLDVLATAVPVSDELPVALADAIAPLASQTDAELWQAARSRLDPEQAEHLEVLHWKRSETSLTEQERQALADLVQQYEKALLVRAQAAALLKQRGHDVSCLLSE